MSKVVTRNKFVFDMKECAFSLFTGAVYPYYTGTVSPLHHDPKHNLLAQVVGSKYIRLYAPEDTASVYPIDSGSIMNNSSQIEDVFNPNLER